MLVGSACKQDVHRAVGLKLVDLVNTSPRSTRRRRTSRPCASTAPIRRAWRLYIRPLTNGPRRWPAGRPERPERPWLGRLAHHPRPRPRDGADARRRQPRPAETLRPLRAADVACIRRGNGPMLNKRLAARSAWTGRLSGYRAVSAPTI